MHQFYGVATKYLPNYLGWRRYLEKQGNSIPPATNLNCSLGRPKLNANRAIYFNPPENILNP